MSQTATKQHRNRTDSAEERRVGDRLATLWSAAAFAAVGLLGLHFYPRAKFLWFTLLVFALIAIPQAFSNERNPPGRR